MKPRCTYSWSGALGPGKDFIGLEYAGKLQGSRKQSFVVERGKAKDLQPKRGCSMAEVELYVGVCLRGAYS
jgi:hypothetical protein